MLTTLAGLRGAEHLARLTSVEPTQRIICVKFRAVPTSSPVSPTERPPDTGVEEVDEHGGDGGTLYGEPRGSGKEARGDERGKGRARRADERGKGEGVRTGEHSREEKERRKSKRDRKGKGKDGDGMDEGGGEWVVLDLLDDHGAWCLLAVHVFFGDCLILATLSELFPQVRLGLLTAFLRS